MNRLQKNTATQLRRYQAGTPGRPLDEAVGKEPQPGPIFPSWGRSRLQLGIVRVLG